ncbi:MAG: T9SS type A sorting domain-containing protein, partial [Flavobacteriaceae bacterium]|nr:T9SS type A sorting domain-containing protein [Flavobacteriaceae bacterium]
TSQTDRYYGRGEGCWIWDSHNIIVQYNKQYRASGFGDTYGSAGHVDFYCKNAIFQYNYSEDTEGGFVEILGDSENITFRYNVSVNDGHRANGHNRYSIWLSGYVGTDKTPVPSNNCYIYNNTVYLDKSRSRPDIEIFAKNTYIYNNIFYAMNGAQIGAGGVGIDIQSGSELVVSNNLFYGDIATAFTNLDNKKITSQDPLYTDPVSDNGSIENFNIQEGSPVINAGLSFLQPAFPMAGTGIFENITEYPTTDIFGETLDINHMGPNIGASNVHNSANALAVHSPQSAQSVFTLYPNPVRDDLNLKLNTNLQKADITIYDLQGRQIYNTSIKEVSNSMKVALPETIRNGIYLIKVSEGQQVQTSQLILYRK